MKDLTGYEGLLAVDLPRRQLTEAETDYFLRLAISEKDGGDEAKRIEAHLRSSDAPVTVKVLMERVDFTGMVVSPCLVAFTALLCDSSARAVLWGYALYKLALEKAKARPDPLSLMDWTLWFGEHGIPDEQGCRLAWDRQKHPDYPNSNWLDGADAWRVG